LIRARFADDGGDHMDNDREDRIRRRAYEIWEQDGRRGDPEEHWLRAERELKELPQENRGIAAETVLPDDAVAAADSATR
jgi:Protein of unknown function (DUF2934)